MAKLALAVRVGIAPDPVASTPNVDIFVLGGARGTHAAVIAVRAVVAEGEACSVDGDCDTGGG